VCRIYRGSWKVVFRRIAFRSEKFVEIMENTAMFVHESSAGVSSKSREYWGEDLWLLSWLILEAWNPIYRIWFAGGKPGNVVSLLLISEGGILAWSWGTHPFPGWLRPCFPGTARRKCFLSLRPNTVHQLNRKLMCVYLPKNEKLWDGCRPVSLCPEVRFLVAVSGVWYKQ
jgi:hypothetical protein